MKKDIVQYELTIGDLRDNASKRPFKRSECTAIEKDKSAYIEIYPNFQ